MDWRTRYRNTTYIYPEPRNAFQRGWNDYYSRPPSSRLDMGTSQRLKYEASGVPFLGDFVRSSDQTRWMNDYLKHTGLSWSDVKYPALASGAGSSARAIANVGYGIGNGAFLTRMMHMYR